MSASASRQPPITEASSRSTAWRMLIIAFLAQNCAIGMNYSSYGTLLTSLQEQFQTSRSLASSGISAMLLVLGLMSPFMGTLITRFSLRKVMVAGAVLNVVGNLLLAGATNIYMLLAIYALVLGPGVCLLGIIAPATLLGHWFSAHRGKALGVMSMPLFLASTPPIVAYLSTHYSPQLVYLILAAVFALLLPLLLTIVERPAAATDADAASAPADTDNARPNEARALMTTTEVLKSRDFWLISLGMGIISGCGMLFLTHLVPIAIEKGIELQAAATLITSYGIAGIGGALLLGWLCDRLGPVTVFTVDCVLLMLLWFLLLEIDNFALLLGITAAMGVCMTSLVGVHAASLTLVFGPQNLPRTMGFGYFVKVPFLFGAAPLAGYMYDIAGNYVLALLTSLASFGVAALLFLIVRQSNRRGRNFISL